MLHVADFDISQCSKKSVDRLVLFRLVILARLAADRCCQAAEIARLLAILTLMRPDMAGLVITRLQATSSQPLGLLREAFQCVAIDRVDCDALPVGHDPD